VNLDFDIVIVGGGLAGMATAAALQGKGYRLALLQPAPAGAGAASEWDSRIYAVTPGNVDFLQKIGAWQHLECGRIAPIHAMFIWGDASNSGAPSLEFDAYQAGLPELGVIAEESHMLRALGRALHEVEILCPAMGKSIRWNAGNAVLQLEDGREIATRLVVGADGGNSWVRQQAGIAVEARPYGQQGVVANFEVEKPHGGIARQWFRQDGILAWLPLPGNRISMVWSAFDPKAQALMALTPEALCREVAEVGNNALGKLKLITPAAAFPLVMQRNQSLIAPRCALVGDAAHRVHPLAGQGINLGWRDVQELASTLKSGDPGEWLRLRSFERARKADVLAMQGVTFGLQKLFNNDLSLIGWLRNTGLSAVNHVAPLKRTLMAHAVA
jgi:ubiquinone biosynthesis UbiH/UbiF/VisC/COQ6 family hydroxylase